jgi:glycosyltransferase involved in cell wall biosynthesis
MRVLFLVTEDGWSARARAFVLAARGLVARGHEVMLACESECPVQVRAAQSELQIIPLAPDASTAGDTLQIRRAVQEKTVDVVFVHTDAEQLIASSAVRLGRGSGAVIRRVPPFALVNQSRGARFATRIAPTGLLFSTEADRAAADVPRHRVPSALAPLSVDPSEHDRYAEVTKAAIGVPSGSRLIVCVHDGADRKTVFSVLRTLSVISPRHPELHLAVIGDAQLDEVRMHGAALGINSMVTYLGARDDELAIMSVADVGWIAADGDAAAFAALDFMAFRTPVLAERSPLTEHYVADGIGGVLLTQTDATTTAAAVSAFLAKEEQRKAMGKSGRARLEREFSYETMIRGYEQAIAGAVDRNAQAVT